MALLREKPQVVSMVPVSVDDPTLPVPPETLSYGDVLLRFARVVFGDPARGIVPSYHFRILAPGGKDAGHINFRVGDTEHVRHCVGHVGFVVAEAFRGHGYAWQASRALAPFIRSIYPAVILTCDPDNLASRRTIEDLGALFMDEVAVPPHDPQYERGSRRKRRYAWIP
jgi:predicted acetyltransferase